MLFENRFEYSLFVFLILGILISFLLGGLFLQGIVILLFGMIAATVYEYRKGLNFPYFFIVIGFLLGYIIATRTGHRFLILFLFILGVFLGQLSKKFIKKYIDIKK